MVYPVFEEKSIEARCLEDIKKFHCICTVKLSFPNKDIDNDIEAKLFKIVERYNIHQ
jgi:hypothetical protein